MLLDRIARLRVGPAPRVDHHGDRHRRGRGRRAGRRRTIVHASGAPGRLYLGVSLFDRVTPDMQVYQEEILGPKVGMVDSHKYANRNRHLHHQRRRCAAIHVVTERWPEPGRLGLLSLVFPGN